MPKLYKITGGGKVARWYITPEEARLNASHGEKVNTMEIDELEIRRFATMWLNTSEIKRAAAIKREAAKTRAEATTIAHKVWATRRANGTDKRKK